MGTDTNIVSNMEISLKSRAIVDWDDGLIKQISVLEAGRRVFLPATGAI
jgi:hypothetical protein